MTERRQTISIEEELDTINRLGKFERTANGCHILVPLHTLLDDAVRINSSTIEHKSTQVVYSLFLIYEFTVCELIYIICFFRIVTNTVIL